MISHVPYAGAPVATRKTAGQLGVWTAILTTVCTVVFAVIAIATPARAGPFCATWGCVASPYTAVAQYIPGDYFWLVPGMLLAPLFVVLCACIHTFAPEGQKLFSRIALLFAGAYALVILADYFTQFTVVMPSLLSGETAGLSLFTQYNPHGFFIAGEALAYMLMSLAFLFAAPVFAAGRVARALRWIFAASFVLAMVAFAGLWLLKNDLIAFEVTILMINWVALIASGVLLSVVFRRAVRPGAI